MTIDVNPQLRPAGRIAILGHHNPLFFVSNRRAVYLGHQYACGRQAIGPGIERQPTFHGDARPVSALDGKASTFSTGRSGPRLISTRGDWLLLEGPNIVGREPDCAVRIDSPTVSRRHARIVVTGADVSVEDLKSKNGTYVNGRRVKQTVPVDDGGEIRVGSVKMTYRNRDGLDSTLSQRRG